MEGRKVANSVQVKVSKNNLFLLLFGIQHPLFYTVCRHGYKKLRVSLLLDFITASAQTVLQKVVIQFFACVLIVLN